MPETLLAYRQGILVRQRKWTDAERATADKLRAEGYSASYIGDVLDRPRNSIIADQWRRGVPALPLERRKPPHQKAERQFFPPAAARRFSFEDA